MKKGKPMTCRWCGKGIRRLADGTHTHRARRVVRTSKPLDLGPIKLPSKTFVNDRPETVECHTMRYGPIRNPPPRENVAEETKPGRCPDCGCGWWEPHLEGCSEPRFPTPDRKKP